MSTEPSTVPFALTATGTGVAQSVESGGHHFDVDTYPAFGGRDAAPSPLVYALSALSSCNQVTASIVAGGLGISLGAWTFDVVGDLNPAVLVEGAEGNANFDKVTVRVTVESDADDATFDRFVSEVERRCPVTQLYKRSGLEFDSAWTRAELPVAAG